MPVYALRIDILRRFPRLMEGLAPTDWIAAAEGGRKRGKDCQLFLVFFVVPPEYSYE